jgi:carbonic anhydrase/acetyltransferase-like protein (isoleucine patch superfamily)
MIGINATILHNAEIGNFCLIGAGCLVSQDMKVPDHSFVVGVPGKVKGRVPEKQMFWLDRVPQEYAELGQQYKEEGLGGK